jgi:hypothetical protein
MALTAKHYLNPAKRPPRRSGLADNPDAFVGS